MANSYEDAALIIRNLKERLDRQETAGAEGPVNVFRSEIETTLGVDTVATSTDTAASFTWDSDDTWDSTEWSE